MVREFGQSLEELVKDYLMFVKEFDIVDTGYPYQLPPSTIKHRNRNFAVRYPTDIDVVGVKLEDNEVWLIECQERVEKKDTEKLRKKFERHLKYSPFSEKKQKKYKIKKKIAICRASNGFPDDKFDILRADDMIKEIAEKIEKIKKEKHSRLTYGRYAWILKWMKYHKMLT